MSNPFVDEIAEKAMAALRENDPEKAATALALALNEAPERLDLIHALAVTELRRGKPDLARDLCERGIVLAHQKRDEVAGMLMPQLLLAQAAAYEDLYDAGAARDAFEALLEHEPMNPRGQQGLGHLLLGWGRTTEGLDRLDRYLEQAQDEEQYLEATQGFVQAVRQFIEDDVHPRTLIEAHRGSYNEFFSFHADRMAKEGWIAEAARMYRDDDGEIKPIIPEGARPYAAVRVDLVDPQTGQPGQVGEQPMVVALAGYEPLAQAPVLFDWPRDSHPFQVWTSTQAPWDQLPIQVRFESPGGDAMAALDAVIGDWYSAGWNGAFGDREAGRLHYISDPEPVAPDAVLYHIDCGRAEDKAVPDLLRRLQVLHGEHPIAAVLIGRGYVPRETR